MKKISPLYIASLVMAGLMFIALFPWPYGYYVLLRFLAMIFFGIMTYHFYKEDKIIYAVVAGALALLFQPFFKIALGREVWQVVDVIVAIVLIAFVLFDKQDKV